MKRPLQLVLALALLVIAAIILLAGPFRDRWQDPLRGLVERALTTALGAPTTIDTMSISLAPPRVVVRGVWIGAERRIASLDSARVHLRLRTSLEQGRPVLDLSATRLTLDLPALLRALPPPTPGPPTRVPPFRLRSLRVREVEVQLTDDAEPLHVSAPAVDGGLASDLVYGRLDFSARLEPATIQRGQRTAVLNTVEVAGGETDTGWQLRRVFLRGEGVSITGSEREDVLRLDGEVELPRLAIIEESLATIQGVAQLKGRLQGTLEAPVLNATVKVPALVVDEQAIGAVEATGRLDLKRLDVSALRVEGYGGQVEGTAAIELEQALPTTANLTWRGVDLREIVGSGSSNLPPATLEGTAQLEGTLDPLAATATASGRVGVAGNTSPLQWKGNGRYGDGGGTADIEMSQGFGNTAKGDLSLGRDGALAGRVQLRVTDANALADLAAVESRPNVRGTLDANATLSGTLSEPRYEGAIDARSLVVAGVQVDAVNGRFAGDRRIVRMDGIRAAIGGGSLRATGTVALDTTSSNAWSVSATGLDGGGVATLVGGVTGVRLPIADGAFTLEASANGPWPRVQMAANARLDRFWLGRERIAELTAAAHAADGMWNGEVRMRNLAQQEAVLRANGRGANDLAITFDCRAWTLASLWEGEEADMGGTLRASATLRGPAAALSGRATLTADALVLRGRAFRDVQLDVTADRGRWRATTAVLDDVVQVAAELRPDPGFPFTVDAVWNEADFAPLIGAQAGWEILSSGSIHATGRLNAISQLTARLDLTKLTVTGGPQPVNADVPVTIACRNGLCTIPGLTVRSGEASLRINGDAGFDGRVRLTVAGGGPLGLLELADSIESARGTFTVDASLTHSVAGWSALGSLSLTQAALDAGLPVAITRTDGRIVFNGTRMHIDDLRGRIGSGTFTVGGDIDLRAGPELTWTLESVGAVPLPSLEVEAGGRGTVAGTWQHLRVGGDIEIIRLLYDRNIELADFLFRFNRALAAAPREADGTDIELALNVRAPGELFVENNLTRMEARAQFSLTGTADRPVLDGRVEALDGDIFLRGRTFELLSGTVDFRPDLGMTAALNITAESLIDTPDGSYVVTVRVTGTTVDPRVTLSSDDPSLSQTDIATLIAFGRTASQLRQGGGGSFSLTSALGNPIGDLLSGQAERVLPIDRIEFEPTFSTTTGAFEPQLTLGKDLTQDLAASIGQTFGIASRTRVEVNYRLGPNVWALGLWESQTETEAGAWAGGLRTRYQFWRLTPYTLVGGLQ